MYGSIGGLTGCLVAINHTVTIMESLERQQAKAEVVTEKETQQPNVNEIVEETTDKTEDIDESKTDSRACNLLEGGADTPVQHDSNGSSSTV
jgi:hypothetical protein